MNKPVPYYINILTICLLCFFSGSGGLVNSSIQSCIEAFPNVSASTIRLTTTLPSLISLPVMILASHYITKIGYKKSMILGTLFMTLGGVGPFFFYSSWFVVMIFRCLTDIGLGFYGLRSALILSSFEENLQAKYIGIGNAMNSFASVLLTPIAGILSGISWRHPFLLFAMGFIILILTITSLKEPEIIEEEKTSSFDKKDIFDFQFISYFILYFIASVVLYPILSGMSSFIILKQLGSLAIAGTLISCHNIGGFIIGFFTDKLESKFKKNTISIAFLIITIGQLLALYVPSIAVIAIGSTLTGIGFFILISTVTVYTGQISTPGNKTLRSTLLLVAMQLGMFLSSYFMEWSHIILRLPTDVESSWLASGIACAICAIITYILKNKLFNINKKS